MIKKLSFAWWNTGLSPSAKSRANDEQRNIAIQVIRHLLLVEKIDFLVLGEIADEDIFAFGQIKDLNNYRVKSGVSKIGHIAFDTCFIYQPHKIAIDNDVVEIDTGRSGSKLKIAQKLTLRVAITQNPLYLFVSHWASRLYCPESSPDRQLLGIRLRDGVDNILSDNSELIILLGDYNDEPFDDSLAQQLMATRDKALVKRKPNLLYNPFWRHLTHSDIQLSYAGTYYHKSGKTTKWRTFDQIIVSSAFLNGELQLNEIETGIVHIPYYLKQVKDGKTIFDHLPVKATIEKVCKNG
jgi:hypothetical protein